MKKALSTILLCGCCLVAFSQERKINPALLVEASMYGQGVMMKGASLGLIGKKAAGFGSFRADRQTFDSHSFFSGRIGLNLAYRVHPNVMPYVGVGSLFTNTLVEVRSVEAVNGTSRAVSFEGGVYAGFRRALIKAGAEYNKGSFSVALGLGFRFL